MTGPLRALGLLALLPALAAAHKGDRVLPVMELSDADLPLIDVHDGSIDDWFAVLGEPALTAADFGGPQERTLDFRMWLAWHGATSRIFVAVETIDDTYVNRGLTPSWAEGGYLGWALQQDGYLGIGIDGDHSGGPYYGDVFYIPDMRAAQEYHALGVVRDDSRQLALEYEGDTGGFLHISFVARPPYGDAGGSTFSEHPSITVTEAYVTAFDGLVKDALLSRRSALEAGRTVGLALKVNDSDGDPDRDPADHYVLPGQWGFQWGTPVFAVGTGRFDASLFADAILLPRRPDEAPAPDLSSLTWARIKSSIYTVTRALSP